MIQKIWHRLFLCERPSISLSFFRMAVAFTTIAHVIPSFIHLEETYFNTAFKSYNTTFFTVEFVQWVYKSPQWLIVGFVWLFCISSFFLLIGFLSQMSCILMTASCYYFYALNAFHVGTLSWDILMVTLFLMCLTSYHGDYFSMDCLIRGKEDAYQRRRPYFMQRLFQLQVGFMFFYTSLYKVTGEGSWFTGNPLYHVMNSPPIGNTKTFLLRDYLMVQPELCYWLGVGVVVIEFLMIFLLFFHKTRISAIYLGCLFQTVLILTLDVPATFFFLLPAQLMLFINPDHIVKWIERKRQYNQLVKQNLIIYDGHCRFCLAALKRLKVMDWFAVYQWIDFHTLSNVESIEPSVKENISSSQIYLVENGNILFGGFSVFRRICLSMPMMFMMIPIIYFPGAGLLGPIIYKFVAKNRYLFHLNPTCKGNLCFRK